jgi:hypothetical protein
MARVHVAGELITKADISSIAWRVLDASDETQYDAGGSLAVASVVFDEPQTDGRWVEDSTGYNFRHDVAHAVLDDVGSYLFVYTFTTTGGSQFIERVEVNAVGLSTSL